MTAPTSADGTPAIECQCCGEWLHRDDFQPTAFNDAKQIEEHHGGPVCCACMDSLVVCDCGTVMPRDDAYSDGEGGWTADAPPSRDDYGDWRRDQMIDRMEDAR
jgi:hypothetical protein